MIEIETKPEPAAEVGYAVEYRSGKREIHGEPPMAHGCSPPTFPYSRTFTCAARESCCNWLEAFNAFNTPNFANPAATFGVCGGQLCSGSATTAGSITNTLIPQRQVQVAAKLLF